MTLNIHALKTLASAILLAGAGASFAQSASAPAPSSPAKKEMIAKLLQMQNPAFDAVSRSLLQQPVNNLMQGAGTALQQQVPADKREATAKAIEADIKKFVDDTTPMMRERAVKLAPSTIGAILEERFSEEELRQLMVWVESPLSQKFAQFGVDAPRALAEKLVADTRPTVEPRLKTLEQGIIKRLNDAGAKIGKPSSPTTPPAAPAAPTKK